MSQPTVLDSANYEKPEEWENHGDMNPKRHGGLFIKWDGHMWEIIQTYHPDDLPEGYTQGRFVFWHFWMEEMDIWVDGQPENGFTEDALKTLDSYSHKPFDPIEDESELPEDETMPDYMNWVIENHVEWLIGAMAYEITHNSHPEEEFSEDYWGYLSHYGIEKENF